MMLSEQNTVPDAALPIEEFTEHLRLGTGFADSAVQDGLIALQLRAAMAAIEARIGKVLLQRAFRWDLAEWRSADVQALPLAPVQQIQSVRMVDRVGESRLVPETRWRLVPDMHRPKVAATGFILPGIPTGGHVRIEFVAGFGAWKDIPADLRQAVLMLAAQFYENRQGLGGEVAIPFGVVALIERWRTVRTFGGAGR